MRKKQKLLWSILTPILLIILVIGGYFIYGFTTYYRLPEVMTIDTTNTTTQQLGTNQEYTISTFNIGYGAYTQDYSFFMDGGKYSRAYNQETVKTNMTGITQAIQQINPDIALFQEVDVDGDRSQHVDEVQWLQHSFSDYASVFTQNYDSAFLFYPVTDPIGKAKSGLVTLAKANLRDNTRYLLPIETGFNKFFDLDRAFTLSHIPVANGKTVALINVHLSAYTKDPAIGQAQLKKLFSKMEEEYAKGNYVIVGGDYNHDMLLGKSPYVFGTSTDNTPRTWTHPFPTEQLSSHFSLATQGLAEQKIPSARDLNEGYVANQTFVTLVDGFIVSDNIDVLNNTVVDLQFMNSDHNPVVMKFKLIEE